MSSNTKGHQVFHLTSCCISNATDVLLAKLKVARTLHMLHYCLQLLFYFIISTSITLGAVMIHKHHSKVILYVCAVYETFFINHRNLSSDLYEQILILLIIELLKAKPIICLLTYTCTSVSRTWCSCCMFKNVRYRPTPGYDLGLLHWYCTILLSDWCLWFLVNKHHWPLNISKVLVIYVIANLASSWLIKGS